MRSTHLARSQPVATPAHSYDDVAVAYDRLIRPRYEEIGSLVRDRAARDVDLGSADVVELSAGTGALTHQLAPGCASYLATDVSRPMMDVGRRRSGSACAGVRWQVADVERLDLPPGSADLVVSSLGPFQDSDRGAAGARRLLRPGGRLVAVTWGDDYRELDVLNAARARLGTAPRVPTTRAGVTERLGRTGWREVCVEDVRLGVVHDSVAAYLAYRQAFGPVPGLTGAEVEEMLAALAASAAEHCDERGRVVLDWHLLLMTARR